MSVASSPRRRHVPFIASLLLAACGDDAATSKDTSAPPADTSDAADALDAADVLDSSDLVDTTEGPDGSDSSAPADTVAPPDALPGDASPDGLEPDVTDTTPDPTVERATVTLDGVATEVTPSVRRGIIIPRESIDRNAFSTLNTPSQLTCEGTGGLTEGGRIINPTSVSISGGFGSNCDPGGTGAQFRIGEENMLYAVREACGGRTGTCAHDFTEAFLQRFGACDYGSVGFTAAYRCDALTLAPSYIVEVTTSLGTLRAEGLDGPGEMSCQHRAASFRLDGQPVTISAAGPCKTTIDQRGPALLAGRIEATLTLAGTDRAVVIDFESNNTQNRPLLAVVLEDDLCTNNTFTATERTVDGATFDDYLSGPLTCQANPARTLDPMTVSIRRPGPGESYNASQHQLGTSLGQGAYTTWAYAQFYSIDHSATRQRLTAYSVQLCTDTTFQDCKPTLPIVYFQTQK